MHGLGTIFGHEMRKILKDKGLLLGFVLLPIISLALTVTMTFLQPKTNSEEEQDVEVYQMYFSGIEIGSYNIGTMDDHEIWVKPTSMKAEEFIKTSDFQKCDVLVDFSEVTDSVKKTDSPCVRIYYYEHNTISNYLKMSAESFVRDAFVNLTKRDYEGVQFREIEFVDIKEKEDSNLLIAMLLPYMLVLPLTANISNFASDTVAGDKSRGTFYQVMLSPVKPLSLIMGKVLSVSVISLVSSMIYIGLDVVGSKICKQLGTRDLFGFADVHITLVQVLLILAYTILLSYFFSNLGVLISLFCKDVSQAQTAQIPVTLICTVSALMSMFRFGVSPAIHYFIPVYNLCLIFQDLLNGRASLMNMLNVAVSLLILAVGVLIVTLLTYRSERVRA